MGIHISCEIGSQEGIKYTYNTFQQHDRIMWVSWVSFLFFSPTIVTERREWCKNGGWETGKHGFPAWKHIICCGSTTAAGCEIRSISPIPYR